MKKSFITITYHSNFYLNNNLLTKKLMNAVRNTLEQ